MKQFAIFIAGLLTGLIWGFTATVVPSWGYIHPSGAWQYIKPDKNRPYTVVIQHDGQLYSAWFSPVSSKKPNPHDFLRNEWKALSDDSPALSTESSSSYKE